MFSLDEIDFCKQKIILGHQTQQLEFLNLINSAFALIVFALLLSLI